MSKTDRGLLRSSARTRLLVAGGVGIGSGVATALLGGGAFALAAGWAAGSLVFLVWVWGAIARMSPAETRTHALLEDDTRTGSHVALVVAALASLAALVVMLVAAGSLGSPLREWLTGAGLVTVMLSWCVVQTLYTLRYAHLHYLDAPNGIDFNQDGDADYLDFAYVAFTMGMTYQVSDTNLRRSALRRAGLGHALLAFLFGAFVLATTINLVAGLASPG
ncbi:DUF1345 domain-containing protein [Pseudoclavibacter chungangensis]|uniref:DUF1345 domain-containing protein n=1 Tax=Pseudoclavibacter chungangensis TaxID=587635 RepID=A0A7J5BZS7_9MICO|nr:DUF1345 domain-containing protein [Pseudoclavibacter chungangensis]KAB1660159.1 DUF1345 domain-containing protein [Pseudoclavibacter chungangensis]NYJ66729.1 putative membrane protein [Pseudoclavibacter chungangensis]